MLHCFERQRAERRRPGLDNRRMRVTAVRLRRDKMTFDACIAVAFAGLLLSACHRHAPTGPTEYAYRPWGFEVAFASAPKETDSPADGANPHSFTVEYQDQTRDFSVWASDLLGRQVDLDTMADPAAVFLAQQAGATPGPKSDTTSSDGVPGREYPLIKNGEVIGTMRFFIASGHFYQLAARSTLGPDDPAAKAFLLSFHAFDTASADPSLASAPADANLAPATNEAPFP